MCNVSQLVSELFHINPFLSKDPQPSKIIFQIMAGGGGGGVALLYQNLLPVTAGKPADLLLFTSSTFASLFMIFHIVDLLTRHSPLVIYSVHTAFSFCSLVDRDREDTAGHCHSLFYGPEKDGGINNYQKHYSGESFKKICCFLTPSQSSKTVILTSLFRQ